MAATGGGIYILVTVWSVFFGKPLVAGAVTGVPQGIVSPPRYLPETVKTIEDEHRSAWGMAPGTMVLVFVFLAAFITYYFVNWKLLAALWRIH